jgi:homoserine kinase
VLLLGIACRPDPASVAVHYINNGIAYTAKSKLHVCDSSATGCTQSDLGFKPVASVYVEGSLVFAAGGQIYRCDNRGQACTTVKLTFSDPASMGVGSSGQVVVVSTHGVVNLCSAASCKLPTPAGSGSPSPP